MMTFDLPHHLRARGEQLTIFDICAAHRELDPEVLADMAFGPSPAPEPANASAANDNSFARVLADLVGPWGRRQQDGGAPASAYPEVPYD
jgi:hypothetical protein